LAFALFLLFSEALLANLSFCFERFVFFSLTSFKVKFVLSLFPLVFNPVLSHESQLLCKSNRVLRNMLIECSIVKQRPSAKYLSLSDFAERDMVLIVNNLSFVILFENPVEVGSSDRRTLYL